jgi:hypothetical protein
MKAWIRRRFLRGNTAPKLEKTLRFRRNVKLLQERTLPSMLLVNTLVDTVAYDSQLSLHEAVAAINAQSSNGLNAGAITQITGTFGTNDSIRFAPSQTSGGDVTIALGQIAQVTFGPERFLSPQL